MTQFEQEIYYAHLQSYLKDFEGDRFHEHYFILYYLLDKLNIDYVKYLEVGLWDGASFFYMTQNPKVKEVVGIDIQIRRGFYDNLQKYKRDDIICDIIQHDSTDKDIVNKLNGKYDIIFIDGDHNYFSILKDIEIYKDLVSEGGYLVFDDYMDRYSPDVKRAIDHYLNQGILQEDFEIIGSLPQHIPIYYDYKMENRQVIKNYESLGTLNNFILKKL